MVGLLTSSAGAAVPSGNLIVNGGAESGAGASDSTSITGAPNWTISGDTFTEHTYDPAGSNQFPDTGVSGAINGGSQFFAGGPGGATTHATQTFSVAGAGSEIDAHGVTATLAGYLGGYANQDDSATVKAEFLDAAIRAPAVLGELTIGPVDAAARSDITNLLSRQASIAVPSGTKQVRITITMTRAAGGTYNDGYADNLSFTLTTPPPAPAGSAPVNQTPPAMTGSPTPNSTLTCNPGVWAGASTTTREFLRSDGGAAFQPISPAGETYTLKKSDIGARFRCREVATNGNGTSLAFSTAKTAAAGVPVLGDPGPTVNGPPLAGVTLNCDHGVWSNAPLSFAYRWLRDGQPITGGTGPEYTVRAADDDQRQISCEVIAANDVDTSARATSPAVTALDGPPRADGPPTLAVGNAPGGGGPAAICSSGNWHDDTGAPHVFRIQDGTGTVLAAASVYTLTGADVGRTLTCTEKVTNVAGSNEATSAPLLIDNHTEIRVTGIEVSQGIQLPSCGGCAGSLPSRDQLNFKAPGRATYQGVTMAAGHGTIVRVFANFTQPALLSTLPGATAELEVLNANGDRLSLLTPMNSPALGKPVAGAFVTLQERANPSASFNFLLPWTLTEHRSLTLRATVTPPVAPNAPGQCAGCHANSFTLSSVPFVITADVPVRPIPLTVGGVQTGQTPEQVFGSAPLVLPLNLSIGAYDTSLAVDGMTSVQADAAVAKRASDNNWDGTQYPIGVFINGTPGLGGSTLSGRVLYGSDPPISIVRDSSRPLTSVTHEIGHGLGLPHADTGSQVPGSNPPVFTGPHPDGTADCGGNSNGQIGELWPPDDEGLIHGVGLDRRNRSIFTIRWSPRALVQGFPAAGSNYYDLMSYCANTNESTAGGNAPDAWISVTNWNRLISFRPPRTPPLKRVLGSTPVRVIVTVDAAGNASIFDVAPGQQTRGPAMPGSPYRIELRDGAGHVLDSIAPNTTMIHTDGSAPGVLLEATLPLSSSIAAVVVTSGGRELARRARSAHPPTASISSPRPGAHVGGKPTTLVRWKAHDGDGDPLVTTVDYSADAGRHWKVVADGVRGSSARVPSRLLSASRKGALRIRVSDGFDVATATVKPLVAAGAPPRVRIIGGGDGGRMRADATLLLRGEAFDDAGRQLKGARLRWFAGTRALGRGEFLTVRGLAAGKTAIRLVATDSQRRFSEARVPVTIVALKPAFLFARAPAHVSAKARRVRVVIASTTAAVFKITSMSYAVGRKKRTITITIKPGRSTLRLKYSLSSAGGVTHGTYVLTR